MRFCLGLGMKKARATLTTSSKKKSIAFVANVIQEHQAVARAL